MEVGKGGGEKGATERPKGEEAWRRTRLAARAMGVEGVTKQPKERRGGHGTPGQGRIHTLGLLKGHWHRGIRETLTGTCPTPTQPSQHTPLPSPPSSTSCTCPTCHTYEVGTRFASREGGRGRGMRLKCEIPHNLQKVNNLSDS